jgi:hypothetical protein
MEQLEAIAISSGDQSIRASNAFSRMTEVVQVNAPDLGRDDDPIAQPFDSPIETHWTRILHYDLFTGRADDSAADPDDFSTKSPRASASDFVARSPVGGDKAMVLAAERSSGDQRSNRIGSPIVAGAILFAICAAMYLDTSGVADVVSTNASATAPERWTTASSGSASNPRIDASQLPPTRSLDQNAESLDNSRECRPGAIDSGCIYD